ncbi:MAG: polysaccharide biosynthesis C-terminal domain-containing protein [Bacteroidales bacterium]|nr:polysaccharide biosynthesis C-terminal domain-containing protein [Bacteroidales bacterium]
MAKPKFINNISGLQLFQLLRFVVFFIISIVFTKSHLTPAEIGSWEMFMFIASFMSFFWVTGIIQSLLPLYNRNRSFRRLGENISEKSPEIFNAFLLLLAFSLLFFLTGHILKYHFSVYGNTGSSPYLNLLLLYLLLSSPVCLIEYIYLLMNRPHRIFQYGIYTFLAQLVFILVPILAGKDIIWAIYGLLLINLVRWIWLIILLFRYAEFRISLDFMKEHLKLGWPLIITSLISGSAQYIDGIIVSAHFDDPGMFAVFRYGAKEFPLVMMLATGLSNAMLPQFGTRAKIRESLEVIKRKSRNLMHYLFPISMLVLLFARWLYPRMFTPDFLRSADIFMIYIMLVIPRLLFPQTIIIGRKRTGVAMRAAIFELALNIPLSLWLVKDYGAVGVALATFVVYFLSKVYMAGYLWLKMKIKPGEYIPMVTFFIYSVLLTILFVLIDHRIIDIN